MNNLVAVPLSALAGVLLARTYERSRSTLLVSIEHALYGDFVVQRGAGGPVLLDVALARVAVAWL